MLHQDKPTHPVAETKASEAHQTALVRPRLNSRDLFVASREIIIEHASDEYRLRLTSQGKLILTK